MVKNQDLVSYTSKTYQTIFNDLLEKIPLLTDKWVNYGENDPGIVLLKLIAATADMLCFNMDFQARENFPHLAVLRSNAQKSYDLINYKMKWYESAVTEVSLRYEAQEGQPGYVIIPNYCQLYTNEGLIFTVIDEIENRTIYTNNTQKIKAIQGMISSISGITLDALKESAGRVYLGYNEVDYKHLNIESFSLQDREKINSFNWTLVDDLTTTLQSGRFFEFGNDDTGNTYIQLCENYEEFISNQYLKVSFIRTDGYEGNIGENVLTSFGTLIADQNGESLNESVIIEGNTATHNGADPETLKDSLVNARIHSSILDSAVTLSDFASMSAKADRVRKCRCIEINLNDPYVRKYDTKDDFPTNCMAEDASNKALYVDNKTELCYRLINNSDGTASYERVDLIIQIVTDTFDYPSINMQNEIDVILLNKKVFCVNQQYSTAFTHIIPYNVIVYYNLPYSETTEKIIQEDVNRTLNNYYNSLYREFGEFIKYKEVVKEVEESNKNIDYVDITYPRGNVQVEPYRFPRLGPVNVVLSDNPDLELLRTVLDDSVNSITESGKTISLTNKNILINNLFHDVVVMNNQGTESDKDFTLPDTELAQDWTYYLNNVVEPNIPSPIHLPVTKNIVIDEVGRIIVDNTNTPISEESETYTGKSQTQISLTINWWSSRKDIVDIDSSNKEEAETTGVLDAKVINTQYPEEVELKLYPMIKIGNCQFALDDALNLIKRGIQV